MPPFQGGQKLAEGQFPLALDGEIHFRHGQGFPGENMDMGPAHDDLAFGVGPFGGLGHHPRVDDGEGQGLDPDHVGLDGLDPALPSPRGKFPRPGSPAPGFRGRSWPWRSRPRKGGPRAGCNPRSSSTTEGMLVVIMCSEGGLISSTFMVYLPLLTSKSARSPKRGDLEARHQQKQGRYR